MATKDQDILYVYDPKKPFSFEEILIQEKQTADDITVIEGKIREARQTLEMLMVKLNQAQGALIITQHYKNDFLHETKEGK